MSRFKKRMKNKSLWLAVFAFVLCFGVAAADFSVGLAQQKSASDRQRAGTATPTPTVKPSPTVTPTPLEDDGPIIIETELVNLNVRVVDRNNRSIQNLQESDFKVYEDNILQPIDYFSKSEVPTNYSLVIDNSGSLRKQLDSVIEASKILVNTNRPEDETSVIRFISSDKIEILQDFTPSKTDLNDALDNMYIDGGQTAIIDAVYLAAERVDNYEKTRDPNDRKRRALILVSDGEDRNSYYKEAQLFELLRESEVQIYVIGFVKELDGESGIFKKSDRSVSTNFLKRLATETGGKAYFPDNIGELNSIAADISSELRTQYSIGYVPTDDRKDGSFRNIKVVVTDGPNKQKRIAVTRNGRTSNGDANANPNRPALQNASPQIKKN